MSKLNENEIFARLKELSKIEPDSVATGQAIQKIRTLLMKDQDEHVQPLVSSRKALFSIALAKFAAAAIIFVGFGFLAGRLSASKPADMEKIKVALETSLKPSLESAIKQDVLQQLQDRLDSALTANNAALKQEIQQQLSLDLSNLTSQTLAACRTINDQRFRDTIDLIEAARQRDRQQVETALTQIRQQTTKFGTGLVAVAAQTDEILRTKEK